MSIRPYRFAPFSCFFVGMVLLVAAFAMPGCNPAPPQCIFTYSQQQSGNISTIVWPAGQPRSNVLDPSITNFTWRNSNGALDSLSNHLGQIILLNFWASWCGPCTSEMPALQSIANNMGDSIFVIGVAVDECSPWSSVSSFVQSNNIKYQIVVDSEWTLYEKYFPNALSSNDFVIPQTFFIGRDGEVKQWKEGEESESAFLSNIQLSQ